MCKYEKLSETLIESHHHSQTPLSEDEFSLHDLLYFYEQEIMPYRYIYTCQNNLTIEFCFNQDNFCHLIFGTIDDKTLKPKYSGKKGYLGISNHDILLEKSPPKLKKKAIERGGNLIFLPKLLSKPTIIHFNKFLVKNEKVKTINSEIDAKFLLDKQLCTGDRIHLFLKEVNAKQSILVPNSFFPNDKDNYIDHQLSFKVQRCSKELRNLKQTNSNGQAI